MPKTGLPKAASMAPRSRLRSAGKMSENTIGDSVIRSSQKTGVRMDGVLLGWAVFWLFFGLLPIIVAAYRRRHATRYRTLNRWILFAGFGQIGLPLAAIVMLMLGFPPAYASRAESSFHFVMAFWAASFVAMWLLFIILGILCRVRPQ